MIRFFMCVRIIVSKKILISICAVLPNFVRVNQIFYNCQAIRILLDAPHLCLYAGVFSDKFDKRPADYRSIGNLYFFIFRFLAMNGFPTSLRGNDLKNFPTFRFVHKSFSGAKPPLFCLTIDRSFVSPSHRINDSYFRAVPTLLSSAYLPLLPELTRMQVKR
jgi:hypothetical protein